MVLASNRWDLWGLIKSCRYFTSELGIAPWTPKLQPKALTRGSSTYIKTVETLPPWGLVFWKNSLPSNSHSVMLWKDVHMSTAKQKWLKITVSYSPDCTKKKFKKIMASDKDNLKIPFSISHMNRQQWGTPSPQHSPSSCWNSSFRVVSKIRLEGRKSFWMSTFQAVSSEHRLCKRRGVEQDAAHQGSGCRA